MATGRLLSEARLDGTERALVIGAATGYSAALLSRLAASVVAVEEDPGLAAFAREVLTEGNVELVEGPLAAGHAAGGPYDFVLVDGAVEQIPQGIVDQVADGGEVALALIEDGVTRLAFGRVVSGAFGATAFADAETAILPGFQKPRTFKF